MYCHSSQRSLHRFALALALAVVAVASGCGVGGLVGGAAGAVILSADHSSSDPPARVELDPAPTREALRIGGDPTRVVVQYSETRRRSKHVTLEYIAEVDFAGNPRPAWIEASTIPESDGTNTRRWDAQRDFGGLDLSEDAIDVRLRMFSGHRAADASESDVFAVGNTHPSITFEFPPPDDGGPPPPGEELVVGGNVNMIFRAKDGENDPLVGTEVFWVVEGEPQVRIDPQPRPFDIEIEATDGGQTHFRLWDSRRDLPDRRIDGVVLLVRARDAFENVVEARTAPFVVDNNDEPEAELLFFDLPPRDLSFEVPIPFKLADANSSRTDIVVQYAFERDAFPDLPPELEDRATRRELLENEAFAESRAVLRIATPSDGRSASSGSGHGCDADADKPSSGVFDLEASPEGTSHVFVWDSAADLPRRAIVPVFLRVTPYDDERGASDTTLTSFAIDNDIFREHDALRLGEGDVRSIATGDVDGDGLDDVAVVLEASVEVFLREADGAGFAPGPQIYGTSTLASPRHVVIADVTANGKPDLIVVDRPYGQSRDSLVVFRDFDPEGDITRAELDSEVMDIVAADFDGLSDIYEPRTAEIVLTTNRHELVVLAVDSVSIRERQRNSLTSEPLDLAIGDLNGDGRQDLVVVRDQELDLVVVSLYMGVPTGPALAPWQDLETGSFRFGDEPSAAGIADFDGDGLLDVAIGVSGEGDVRGKVVVFRNELGAPGSGMNGPPLAESLCEVGLLGAPASLIVSDVTNDGELDFVVLAQDEAFQYELVERRGECEWVTFKRITVDDSRLGFRSAAVLEMNGDGGTDLALATPDGAVLVPQSRAGTVGPTGDETIDPPPDTVFGDFGDVRIADINRDRLPDVIAFVVPRADEYAVVAYFQDRLGRYPSRPNLELPVSSEPRHFDVNLAAPSDGFGGSGRVADVIAVSRLGGLDVFVSSGERDRTVSFERAEVEDAPRDIPRAPLLVGDLGGASGVDIARMFRGENRLILYEVDVGPEVREVGSFPLPPEPRQLAGGDFDCDGRLDIATYHADGRIFVFLQRPGVPEERFALLSTIETGRLGRLELADIDGNRRLDIVAATGDKLMVVRQSEHGEFDSPPSVFATGVRPWWRPAVCEFNGDGVPDLALTDLDHGQLSLFLQKGGGFADRPSFHVDLDESFVDGSRVVCGDLSGDGRPEVLVVRSDGGQLVVLRAR